MENVIINPGNRFGSEAKKRAYEGGSCVRCGETRDAIYVLCASCRARASAQKKLTKKTRVASGLCLWCAKPSLPNSQKCRDCFFYNLANVTLKNVKLSQPIAFLFAEQGERCVYTDEILILGVNASIDHKLPQCRGGQHVIENLQWVSKRINGNKYNLTHEEFVTECASIAAKFR